MTPTIQLYVEVLSRIPRHLFYSSFEHLVTSYSCAEELNQFRFASFAVADTTVPTMCTVLPNYLSLGILRLLVLPRRRADAMLNDP